MTTGPAALRLQDNSLLGISAGVVAAVAAGSVCKWAGLPDPATTSVTVLALGQRRYPLPSSLACYGLHMTVFRDAVAPSTASKVSDACCARTYAPRA
jgi:hypothetical protein